MLVKISETKSKNNIADDLYKQTENLNSFSE